MTREQILTVDAALVADGQILLIRRKKDPYRGKLAFPGGRLEEDEYELEDKLAGAGLRKAAAREVGEEVGLDVHEEDLELVIELTGEDRDPRPGHNHAAVYWTRVDRAVLDTAEADSDAESVHIVALVDLCEDDMAFDHWLAIERLKEIIDACGEDS